MGAGRKICKIILLNSSKYKLDSKSEYKSISEVVWDKGHWKNFIQFSSFKPRNFIEIEHCSISIKKLCFETHGVIIL